MSTLEPVRYREEFAPYGFRKIVAALLVVSAVVLPPLVSWQSPRTERPAARSYPSGRFAPRGGFLPERPSAASILLGWMVAAVKFLLVVVVATLGLLMYYPRPGFKRYAAVCGPLLALVVPACVTAWLSGREEVYDVELVAVAVIAAAPVMGLYVWLTWRKARRLGMSW